jgi:hypothetical protein
MDDRNEMASKTISNAPRDAFSQASEPERSARVALEERVGHPLSEMEWEQARARLVELVSLLRVWYLGFTSRESKSDEAA